MDRHIDRWWTDTVKQMCGYIPDIWTVCIDFTFQFSQYGLTLTSNSQPDLVGHHGNSSGSTEASRVTLLVACLMKLYGTRGHLRASLQSHMFWHSPHMHHVIEFVTSFWLSGALNLASSCLSLPIAVTILTLSVSSEMQSHVDHVGKSLLPEADLELAILLPPPTRF